MKMIKSRTPVVSAIILGLLIAFLSCCFCGCDVLDSRPEAPALPVTSTFPVTNRSEAVTRKRVSSVQEIAYDNGEKYAGFIKDGLPHGYGIKSYPDGARYEGNWQDGFEYGMETYFFPNGDRLEAEWKSGMANGPGTYYRSNGETVIGLWKDNELIQKSTAVTTRPSHATSVDVAIEASGITIGSLAASVR